MKEQNIDSTNIKYSTAIKELEGIVSKIESESCNIDSLADNVKRAIELISVCKAKLTETEEELDKIFNLCDMDTK